MGDLPSLSNSWKNCAKVGLSLVVTSGMVATTKQEKSMQSMLMRSKCNQQARYDELAHVSDNLQVTLAAQNSQTFFFLYTLSAAWATSRSQAADTKSAKREDQTDTQSDDTTMRDTNVHKAHSVPSQGQTNSPRGHEVPKPTTDTQSVSRHTARGVTKSPSQHQTHSL